MIRSWIIDYCELNRLGAFKSNRKRKNIKKIWFERRISTMPIIIRGSNAIPSFEFSNNNLINKTYLTQEMLKNKILATNMIYVNIFHNQKIIKKYKNVLDKVFFDISKKKIKKLLKSKVCFKPINRIN